MPISLASLTLPSSSCSFSPSISVSDASSDDSESLTPPSSSVVRYSCPR